MFGGRCGNNSLMADVAKFNIEECTWSLGAPMPTARSAACPVTVGTSIYVVGGRTFTSVDFYDSRMDATVDVVEQYDTLENVWAWAPRLNRPRAYCSALLVGSSIFVLGGCASLTLESLDLNDPAAWQVFSTEMPTYMISTHFCPRWRDISFVSVAVGRKIYVLGGGYRNGTGTGCVLDLDTCAWATFPRPPMNHDYFTQALALDESIYLFGGSNTGVVNKYDPTTSRWLTLPSCKEGKARCYLACLVRQPSQSSSISPFQEDNKQPLYLRGHSSVIQDVQHPDEAAAVDPAEAAAVVAEQWTQQAELNLGTSSSCLQPPGLLLRLLLLNFTRHPPEFHKALLECTELQSCREQMRGLPCRLDSGTLIFLEPFQYHVAIEAAMEAAMSQQVHLTVDHVITSERYEASIMQAVRGLKSRLNVRLRSKRTIVEPHATEVVRTFLYVPDRCLRSIASVTHSTTDAHGVEITGP